MNGNLPDLETALNQNQVRTAPIRPMSPEELQARAKQVQIPTVEQIVLNEACVSKVLVKFNVGNDFRDVPKGVKEKLQMMNSTARMATNLKLAVEVGGEGLDDKNRLPGRAYDTALGLFGGKNVKLLRVSCMTELAKAGLKLVDVNCQRSGGGNYIVAFEYTRVAPETSFAHCEERLAKELESRFSAATSQQTTIFYNPNKSVTVNVGPYCPAKAKKKLVVRSGEHGLVLKLEDAQ